MPRSSTSVSLYWPIIGGGFYTFLVINPKFGEDGDPFFDESIFFRWSWSKPPSTQWPFFGPKNDLHLLETHTTQKIPRNLTYIDTKICPYYHILKGKGSSSSPTIFSGEHSFVRFSRGINKKIHQSRATRWVEINHLQPVAQKNDLHPFPAPSRHRSRPTRNAFRKVPSIAWTTTPLVFPGPWVHGINLSRPGSAGMKGDWISGLYPQFFWSKWGYKYG